MTTKTIRESGIDEEETVMALDTEKLLEQASQAVREAGELFARRDMAGHIRQKGATDFVTQVDLEVQTMLQKRLAEIAPEVQFMGEEKDNSQVDLSGAVWILDPVDGTTNLIHGYCHSAVSLALAEGGEVTMALIYDPYAGELFTARKGHGAFCNGQPIHVSGAQHLSDSLVDVGTNPGERHLADRTFAWMRAIYDASHDVRRIGAASICLCYVAAGRIDGYVEGGLKPWDFGAGMLLVREAGGMITTAEGAPLTLDGPSSVMAANGHIGPELLALINQ